MNKLPFVDLTAQYQNLKPEMDAAIQEVIDKNAFIGGEFVKRFNEEYAEAYGVKHCIGVANGTDAIYIVLKMLGIGEGDEVITVANSWISTSETISQTGATPVFVDIEPDHFTIDVNQIEDKITSKTKAIIPVHLYGHPADLDPIKEICNKHNLYLIEDSAQAHFAEYKGKRVGLFGDAATFSFYPGKNLGAYGDAGCIITNDDDLAEKCRMFANHGSLKKHDHFFEGINSRLDGIQAAVLSVKLPHIHEWTEARRNAASIYSELLAEIDHIEAPKIADYANPVFHVYVVKAKQRDELRSHLAENGIPTGIHYPTPLPLLTAYNHLGHTIDDFPVSYELSKEILSLPIFPEITREQIEMVVEEIQTFYSAVEV